MIARYCDCGRGLERDEAFGGDYLCSQCGKLPKACSCPMLKPDIPPRRLVLTPASEIEPEPVTWAWEDESGGRIPCGSFGLFAGREGTGKSSALIWKAARVTRGELPGAFRGQPRAVIYIATEDSWKFTIVPRLMAAGADLSLVFRVEVITSDEEKVTLSLPADIRELAREIKARKVALVILDPLMSAVSDKLDTHVNKQVRSALEPLVALADETSAIISGIAHFNKSAGNDASSLIVASGAFKDVARFIFAFVADDDGRYVMTQTKNSLGRSNLPSLAYRIIEATVETPKGDAKVGRFVPDGTSERTVGDILAAKTDGGQVKQSARAVEWLRAALAGGPVRSKELEDAAKHAAGISGRTYIRARQEAGVLTRKAATGPFGSDQRRKAEWWTALPHHEGDLHDVEQGLDGPPKAATSRGGTGNVGCLGILRAPGPDGLGCLDSSPGKSGCLDSEPGMSVSGTAAGNPPEPKAAKAANTANTAKAATVSDLAAFPPEKKNNTLSLSDNSLSPEKEVKAVTIFNLDELEDEDDNEQ